MFNVKIVYLRDCLEGDLVSVGRIYATADMSLWTQETTPARNGSLSLYKKKRQGPKTAIQKAMKTRVWVYLWNHRPAALDPGKHRSGRGTPPVYKKKRQCQTTSAKLGCSWAVNSKIAHRHSLLRSLPASSLRSRLARSQTGRQRTSISI